MYIIVIEYLLTSIYKLEGYLYVKDNGGQHIHNGYEIQ